MFSQREQGEPVDPSMLPDPVPDLDVVRVRVLCEAGGFRLLRREEPLLGLSDLEEPALRVSMTSRHNTILQLNRRYMQLCSPVWKCFLQAPGASYKLQNLKISLWAVEYLSRRRYFFDTARLFPGRN